VPRRNISPSSLILLDEVMDAGAEIVPAGIDREDRRHPQQDDADQGGRGQDLLAGFARDQKADRDQLDRGLPFRQLGHGYADPQGGQIFPKPETRISRHRITMAAHRVQPWMLLSAASISRQDATRSLSAIGSSMRPKADCWSQ